MDFSPKLVLKMLLVANRSHVKLALAAGPSYNSVKVDENEFLAVPGDICS